MRIFELVEQKFRSFMLDSNTREIHIKCDTFNETCNLCKALDKLNFKWCDGDSLTYLEELRDEWDSYEEHGEGNFYMLIDYMQIKIAINTQNDDNFEVVSLTFDNDEYFDDEDLIYDFEEPNKFLTYNVAMNMLKEIRKELRSE